MVVPSGDSQGSAQLTSAIRAFRSGCSERSSSRTASNSPITSASVSPGIVRRSISISQWSGTMFTFEPPRITPTFTVGAPRSSWSLRKRIPATAGITFAMCSIAFVPSWGVEPWAETPSVTILNQAAPRSAVTRWRSVGSPTTASSTPSQ